jgi:hypothetical protein
MTTWFRLCAWELIEDRPVRPIRKGSRHAGQVPDSITLMGKAYSHLKYEPVSLQKQAFSVQIDASCEFLSLCVGTP